MEPTPAYISLNIRLPVDMHAQVRAQAAAGDRSLNSQVVRLLRFALAHAVDPPLTAAGHGADRAR